jgi:integrase
VIGTSPERLTKQQLDVGREQLIAATRRLHPDHPIRTRPLTTRLHGAEATLFHAGVIDVPPRKRHPDKSAVREREWAAVTPRLRATFEGYIEQMRLSLRPATMVRVEAVLREFAVWLTVQEPAVAAVSDLRRAHIERYKRHLAARPSVRGGRLSNIGLAEQLGTLRACLERLSEWDGDDAPTRVLMFAGDIPRRDEPLPRFIDDAAAAKLLRAAREHPDPFTRLAVEFLARTGLRKGEFLDLTVDSVVQIGAAYWLHVPLGKLRTDRYIPLHPQLKDLLDQWVAHRPVGLREPWLFIERGRRIGKQRVGDAIAAVAHEAGIGRVTPHHYADVWVMPTEPRGSLQEADLAVGKVGIIRHVRRARWMNGAREHRGNQRMVSCAAQCGEHPGRPDVAMLLDSGASPRPTGRGVRPHELSSPRQKEHVASQHRVMPIRAPRAPRQPERLCEASA